MTNLSFVSTWGVSSYFKCFLSTISFDNCLWRIFKRKSSLSFESKLKKFFSSFPSKLLKIISTLLNKISSIDYWHSGKFLFSNYLRSSKNVDLMSAYWFYFTGIWVTYKMKSNKNIGTFSTYLHIFLNRLFNSFVATLIKLTCLFLSGCSLIRCFP